MACGYYFGEEILLVMTRGKSSLPSLLEAPLSPTPSILWVDILPGVTIIMVSFRKYCSNMDKKKKIQEEGLQIICRFGRKISPRYVLNLRKIT